MTAFEEWWGTIKDDYFVAHTIAQDAWNAGTAAERKRILGLLDTFVLENCDNQRLRWAIEHPEPDAGETKS